MVFSVGLQGNGSNVTDLDRNSNFYLYLNSCDFNIANVNLVFKGGARYTQAILLAFLAFFKNVLLLLLFFHVLFIFSYFYNLFGPALGDIVRYELNRKVS